MREIELNLGMRAIVDAEDYEKVNKYKWLAKRSGKNSEYYARRNTHIDGKRKTLWMSRVVMDTPGAVQVDHINGNTLDNRKSNLRFCSHTENMRNRKLQKNNKLGIKGVYCDRNKFKAQIGFNGKNITLGRFNVLGDADSAYRVAEEKYFGEFARKPSLAKA